MYEVPLAYEIIMRQTPASGGKPVEPPVSLIKTVCAACRDPALRKPRFKRLVEKYERQGLCCRRYKRITPEQAAYYEKLRKKKLAAFMEENRLRIDFALREVRKEKMPGN